MLETQQGRTYMIVGSERVPNPKYNVDDRSTWINPPNTVVRTETPYVVPNGKWVAEYNYGNPIGPGREAIQEIVLETHGFQQSVLLVSDQPFGYVVTGDGGRRCLYPARQIHKGELGRGPEVARLSYVRQAFPEGTKGSVRGAHQRRRGYGWTRLGDLVKATGLSAGDIMAGYGKFAGRPHYQAGLPVGTLFDIVVTNDEAEISGREPTITTLEMSEYTTTRLDDPPESVWVRRGFATTVLRLQALGYSA